MAYSFRSRTGKPIVAYWLAAHSAPGDAFQTIHADLTIANTGIRRAVLIDVVSGAIEPIAKPESSDLFPNLPVRDSVIAIADENYFDWPLLPEAPSSLTATAAGNSLRLHWEMHGGDPANAIVERRAGDTGPWTRIATQPAANAEYADRTNMRTARLRRAWWAIGCARPTATGNRRTRMWRACGAKTSATTAAL
jgi:hypothetical protein